MGTPAFKNQMLLASLDDVIYEHIEGIATTAGRQCGERRARLLTKLPSFLVGEVYCPGPANRLHCFQDGALRTGLLLE